MGILALLSGVAVLTASAPEGPALPPMQITVQVGTLQWVEPQVGAIRRVSVANPTIAQIETVSPERISIQGLQVGRTVVILWTDVGRTTILVKVEIAPQEHPLASQFRQPAGPLAAGPGQSLYMYQGQVLGSGTGSPENVKYTAMHHQLSAITPVLAGTASAAAQYDGISGQPGRVSWVHLGYTDPLYGLELGDLSLSTITVLGAAPVVRGGMASYHDGKYNLLVFGGVTPDVVGSLYGLEGIPQLGMQSRFDAADNLSFQLQAIHSGKVDAYGGPLTTITPTVHWAPLTSLSFDGEGSMHAQGGAARARFAYDAPLVSIHGLYQTLGTDFVAPSAERSDLGQLMLVLTPSAYYRLSGSIGMGTSGGSLADLSTSAVSRMADASLAVTPNGLARGATIELGYSMGDTRDDRGISGTTAARTLQRVTGGVSDNLGGVSYRLVATAQDDRFQSTTVDTGVRNEIERSSLGGTAQLTYPLLGWAVSGTTSVTYERRRQRNVAPAAATESFDYWQAMQGLLVRVYPITFGVDALLGQQMSSVSSNSWGARATIALRPSAAHELRAQAFVFGGTQLNAWEGIPYETQTTRYYTGLLSYTYAFGSAVDASPMFGLLGGGDLEATVFLDRDEDGVRDDSEGGVEGVVIVVDGEDRRTSDRSGYAHVGHLAPGDHTVRVDLTSAAGYRFTTASSRRFNVQREERQKIEIGVSDSGQVFGTLFNDLNLNGELDPGEPGVDGVLVAVGNDEDAIKQIPTTAGHFTFRGLGPGEYVVAVDPRSFPPNYVWGGRNGDPHVKGKWYSGNGSHKAEPGGKGGDTGAPSGSNGYDGALPSGSNGYGAARGSNGYDASAPNGSNGYPRTSNGYGPSGSNGFRRAAASPRLVGVFKIVKVGVERSDVSVVRIPLKALRSISGRVYVDRDRDRKFTDRDEPAANVTVRIGNRQATTDAQGRYLFRDLPAGPMTVTVDGLTLPRGRVLASPASVKKELPAEPSSDTVDFILTVPM